MAEENEAGKAEDTLTVDRVRAILQTDEGEELVKSLGFIGSDEVDRRISKAIATHDEKQAPEIEKKLAKAREEGQKEGSMSEAEKQAAKIDALSNELSSLKGQLTKKDRDAELRQYAESLKVPSKAITDVLANSAHTLETGKASIDAIAETIEAIRKESANSALIDESHKPSGSQDADKEKLPYDPYDNSLANRLKAADYIASQRAGKKQE